MVSHWNGVPVGLAVDLRVFSCETGYKRSFTMSDHPCLDKDGDNVATAPGTVADIADPRLPDNQKPFGEFSPLVSLQELLEWEPNQNYVYREVYIPYERLYKNSQQGDSRQKILCCHDMKGGYLDDRYMMGAHGNAQGYTFRHWHAIDGFIYFSHYFVTIPPAGWTNAAHRHNCPIYGTVITEWEEGKQLCTEMLSSEAKMDRSIQQLVNICLYYRFDGWLINIENAVDMDLVGNLLEFLQRLTSAMHRAIPHSKVIWYDAVTTQGSLEWQNNLTILNKPFFDKCDGIWINYTWKEGDPNKMRDAAGERKEDVFIGVDCFGRGTYGGGGLNTYLPIEAIHLAGMNVGVFACCWPYEHYLDSAQNNTGGSPLSEMYSSWYAFDEEFWYRIQKVWNKSRHTVTTLPFSSDFAVGSGSAYYSGGKLVGDGPWYNMSLQNLQSTPWMYDSHHSNIYTCHISRSTAYNRSNCFVIKGGVGEPIRIRLFPVNIPIPGKSGIALRCTAAVSNGVALRISIKFSRPVTDSGKPRESVMVELDCSGDRNTNKAVSDQPSFASTVAVKEPSKQSNSGYVILNPQEENTEDAQKLEGCPWITSEFGIPSIDVPPWVFTEGYIANIDAIIRPTTGGSMCKCNVAIGNVSVWFSNEPLPQCQPVGPIIPADVELYIIKDNQGQDTAKQISTILVWECPKNIHRFQVWSRVGRQLEGRLVWSDATFLTALTVPAYVIQDMRLDLDVVAIRFQVLTEVGSMTQPLRSAKSVTLTFPELEGPVSGDEADIQATAPSKP